MRWSLVLQRLKLVPFLLNLAGCAAGAANAQSGAQQHECSIVLESSQVAAARRAVPAETRRSPRSRLVVNAEMPLAPLTRTLEARIQTRLGEGRVRIGPGGTVSYSAERGALSLSVSGNALRIETPVRARAEACRGDDCYASCAPEALVRAEVPLLLTPDYRFEKATVSVRFTRGCQVRALGGLLTLDVTPTLEAQLAPQLDRVAQEIDQQIPDIRAEIQKAWSALSTARELPISGCFVLEPLGVVQGPIADSTQVLSARFALLATPELRAVCGEPPPSNPLPPLQRDLALPEAGVLQLAMVMPLASLARAFESAGRLSSSGKQLRVARANVTARGADVDAELTLAGEVCGDVAFGASLDFNGDGQLIGLTRARLADRERARLKDAGLEPDSLLRALAASSHVMPLLSVRAFRDQAPTLAARLSQPTVEVSATVTAARAAGASARGDDLVAWLEADGAVWLRLKNP